MKNIEYVAYAVVIVLSMRKTYRRISKLYKGIKEGRMSALDIEYWFVDYVKIPF